MGPGIFSEQKGAEFGPGGGVSGGGKGDKEENWPSTRTSIYHSGDPCSLSLRAGWLYANLTQVRAILEEETSTEKMLP